MPYTFVVLDVRSKTEKIHLIIGICLVYSTEFLIYIQLSNCPFWMQENLNELRGKVVSYCFSGNKEHDKPSWNG